MPVYRRMYAAVMENAALERKAFFVEPQTLKQARRILRAKSDGEAVRLALARVQEIEESWKPLLKLGGRAKSARFEGI